MGNPCSILHSEEEIRSGVPAEELIHASMSGKWEGEGWMTRKNGTLFWSGFVVTLLHNGAGYVIMVRDLTNRKELEQIAKANAILNASNKELERFAYIASHDLKEPVRKILMYSSMLTGETLRQQENITKVNESSQRVQMLIDNMFQYTTMTEPKPFQRVSLDRVLDKVLLSLDASLKEKNVLVRYEELPEVSIIPAQIEQLFHGLISNAIKFCSNEGGTPEIDITTQVVRKEKIHPGSLEVLWPSGRYLVIKVKDNGIGFEQRYGSSIFELVRRLQIE